jgi:glycosyltransferase involved in cell wall biosynthesis
MHDLGHLRFPSGFSHVHSLLEKLAFRIVKRNATMIITPSEVVRREVISYFQIRPERVHAIHQGIEDRFFTAITSQSKEQARIKYKLPERYCLFLGHLNPRKNVKKLLKAYNILAGDRDIPPLVIAGGEGFNFSTELTSLSAAREKVIFPGYIDEADLPTILAGAAVFIFVPLYEGFGFPPLEAMAVGTPVVASAIPVLLETLSDAALFVDPMSPDSIAEGIHSLIATPSLWSELQHKGRQRAKLFSWATTATEVLRVYESLI